TAWLIRKALVLELGREKHALALAAFGKDVAEHALRLAIGGCGVDQRATTGDQALHYALGTGALCLRGANVEHDGGSQPDRRQVFTRVRNGPHQQSWDAARGWLLCLSLQPPG